LYSIADALGMGAGFTLALTLIASIREALGNGTVLGYPVFGAQFDPAVVMILAPGAFLTIGLLIGLMNHLGRKP
jgi:electron transport complex protein RnfE